MIVFIAIVVSFLLGLFFGAVFSPKHEFIIIKDKDGEYHLDNSEREVVAFREEPETTNNEGVGIVMRPSAEELKKMSEDEITKQNKEATAETFGRVGEPRI